MARLWLAAALSCSLAQFTAAHSHIAYVIIDGLLYPGYDPKGIDPNPDNVVGWSTSVTDDGFVPPSNYSTTDIICHRDGAPVKGHAPVRAGEKIHLQWNGWPESHHGPVLSYLAPCGPASTNSSRGDGCASVDKTKLSFFKIDNSSPAFVGEPDGPPGNWATDTLISHNNSWLLEVPPSLEPGPYVLRHELIALHYANMSDGAQNYPQCINLWVMPANATNTGSSEAATGKNVGEGQGMSAQKLYHENDPGVVINIHETLTTYVIPGPTVVSGAAPIPLLSQSKSLSMGNGVPVSITASTAIPFPNSAPTAGPAGGAEPRYPRAMQRRGPE